MPPPTAVPARRQAAPAPRPPTSPSRSPSRPRSTRPAVAHASGGDSAAEVLPLAELVEPVVSAAAASWSEPVAAEPPEALPLAEVVYVSDPYPDAFAAGDDLFSPGGVYGDPLAAGPVLSPLRPPTRQPSSSDETRQPRRGKRPSRPLGIYLLSSVHFLAALILLAAMNSVVAERGLLGRHSPASVSVAVTIAAAFVIAMGVGLFRGMKFAWWLEAFGFTQNICGNGISVVLALAMPLITGLRNPLFVFAAFFVFKYVMRMVISSLLLAYLFKKNVRAFFGLKQLDTGQALGILFGIAITLSVVLGGVGLFLLRDRFAPQPLPHRAANLELPPAAPAPENRQPLPPAAGVAAPPVDQTAVGFLGDEVSAGPYRLRLPSGMESVRRAERTEFGMRIVSWAGPLTGHGKPSTITIRVLDLPQDPAPNELDLEYDKLQKRAAGGVLQKVLVMGKPFIRVSSQFGVGIFVSGIKFSGYDGRRYVTLAFSCPEPEGSPAYKLLESSLLSIH